MRGGGLPHIHLVLLVLIAVVGLLRGLFWVVATEIWNPTDEAQHYAYVESLATGLGIPIAGKDRVSLQVLEIAKRSPTLPFISDPVRVSPQAQWGAFGEQYEGGQGPTYYGLLAVPFLLSRGASVTASIYALRIASILIALLAVPLTYFLARELFARMPSVWLGAPAFLVVVSGFNSNLASINNDALVVPLSAAAFLPLARAWRSELRLRQALISGLLVGLALVTKGTTIGLIPTVFLAIFVIVVSRGRRVSSAFRWLLVFGAASLVTLSPWLVWNLAKYHTLSAARAVDRITGPLQPHYPANLEGLKSHLSIARRAFWEFSPATPGPRAYGWVFEVAAAVALVLALLRAWRKREGSDSLKFFWLSSVWPIAFASMLFVIYGLFGGVSSVVGRHLYIALVPLCILIVGGLVRGLGTRVGILAALLIATFALSKEEGLVRNYVNSVYAGGVIGAHFAPRMEQPWADEEIAPQTIRGISPCPAAYVGLGVRPKSPPTLAVRQGEDLQIAHLEAVDRSIGIYRLDKPVSGGFALETTQDVRLLKADGDRDPLVRFEDTEGDPVIRLYCPVGDAKQTRFAQLYRPFHPDWVTYRALLIWPRVWTWAASLALLGAAGAEVRRLALKLSQGAGQRMRN